MKLYLATSFIFVLMMTIEDGVFEVIKKETRQAHIETEQLLVPRLKSIKTKEDYAEVLCIFYGYFKPLQEKIEVYVNEKALPDIAERRKAAVLERDIFYLEVKRMPDICSDLPTIHHLLQAFGALYVIEGSTLGGEIITKMLRKNTSVILPENTLHFFRGYEEHNVMMWQRFKASLQKHISNEDQLYQLVHAANETFIKFKNWILKFH